MMLWAFYAKRTLLMWLPTVGETENTLLRDLELVSGNAIYMSPL